MFQLQIRRKFIAKTKYNARFLWSSSQHFSIKYPIFRLTITTIAEYDQFKNGEIGDDYDTVIIDRVPHPMLLLETKLFADKPQSIIKFEDVYGNRVILELGTGAVRAAYTTGKNWLTGLPSDFDLYYIVSFGKSAITDADLDSILTWEHARRITISDDSDVAFKLSQRIDDLKHLTALESLTLDISPQSYMKLQAKPFLDGLNSLNYLGLFGPQIERNDILAFSANQEPVKGWDGERVLGDFQKWCAFTRVGADVWFD